LHFVLWWELVIVCVFTPNRAEVKELPPVQSYENLVNRISELEFESPEMVQLVRAYFDQIRGSYENKDGEGPIEAYLELAKAYRSAGFLEQSIDLLDGPENSLADQAYCSGFDRIGDYIVDIAREWRNEMM
jgi:hypothetical protein